MVDIFVETPRFDFCPALGAVAEPQYRVIPIRVASGREKRGRGWTYPLVRLTYTVGPREETEIQDALKWFHGTSGGAIGFRAVDRSDYKSCYVSDTPLNTDQPLLDIGGGLHQLIKRYQVGLDQDNQPVYQDRPIYKPVPSTVILSGAGSVDYQTGIVTGASPGTTAGFEYDLPVRFEPSFPVELISRRIQSVSFSLIELRTTDGVG